MAKAILVYGSTTGNTERLAGYVVNGLERAGINVVVKEVSQTNVNELKDYDLIILGCSTWGIGELQDDFISFYEKMKDINLDGKKAAVFGPGDSETYPDSFCKAVDILEEKLKECGAQIVIEGLKVDGDVEVAKDEAETWGNEIAKCL